MEKKKESEKVKKPVVKAKSAENKAKIIKKIVSVKKKVEAKKAVVVKPKVVKSAKPKPAVAKLESPKPKSDRYLKAIGRRKTSRAQVRLWTRGENAFIVNGKDYKDYFPGNELQQIASSALKKMKCDDKFKISVKVEGGGIHSQAEAVRHGISRVLIIFNENFQKRLRKAGYLTRDPRMRERKKFGLKRARRAPQWRKR
jgi:small subunit ribosomal protein S9